MHPTKKLYIILLVLILGTTALFSREIKRALNITVKPEQQPIISDGMADIPIDKTDPVLGNPGAPITLVMFGDLGCSKCHEVYTTISEEIRNHPQEIRLVWKSTPRRGWFSSGDFLSHQAAYCAGKQGQFWQFIQMAMQEKSLNEAKLQKIADSLKLNNNTWTLCINSDESKNKIADTVSLADSLGIKTLPAIIVNNKLLNITPDINLKELLESFVTK